MISGKNKIIFIIATAFLSCVAIVFFIIIPTTQDIKSMYYDIEKEKENLEIKYQKGQFIKNMMKDYKEIQPQLPELDSIFIAQGQELQFITALEKIAQKYNIVNPGFKKINRDEKDKKNPQILKKLPLTIQLEGNFLQIMGFLAELDSLDYYFNISDIYFASVGEPTGKVSAIINGEALIK